MKGALGSHPASGGSEAVDDHGSMHALSLPHGIRFKAPGTAHVEPAHRYCASTLRLRSSRLVLMRLCTTARRLGLVSSR